MSVRGRPNNFTLRQLDIFVSAAQCGSFALTADRFGISQPAVSDHIRTLEKHLGQHLFDRRRGTTAVLTRAGEELLARATGLLSASESLRQETPPHIAEGRSIVRLAVTPRVRDTYVKPMLARIFRDLPNLDVQICPPVPIAACATALEAGELDLVVTACARPPSNLPNLHILRSMPLALIAAPAVAAGIAAGEPGLDDMPILMPSYAQTAGAWLDAQLARAGRHQRRPIRFVEFSDVIQTLVEDGLALAILLEEEVGPDIARGRFMRLGTRLEPMLRIIVRSPHAPRAAQALERMLIHAMGERHPEH